MSAPKPPEGIARENGRRQMDTGGTLSPKIVTVWQVVQTGAPVAPMSVRQTVYVPGAA